MREGANSLPLPNRKTREGSFAIADQLLGGSRIRVVCEDKNHEWLYPWKNDSKARVRAGDFLVVEASDIRNQSRHCFSI